MLICHSHRFHICCNECGTCDKLLRCHTCHIIHMWAFPHGQTYPSHMYLKYEVDNRLGGRLELAAIIPNVTCSSFHQQPHQQKYAIHRKALLTPGGHLCGLGSDRRGQLHLLRLCAFWGTGMLHMARKPLWTANRWFSWQAHSFFFTFLLLQEVFANLKLPWEKPTFWSKYCAFLFIKCTQIKLGVFYPSILIPPSKLKEIFLFS